MRTFVITLAAAFLLAGCYVVQQVNDDCGPMPPPPPPPERPIYDPPSEPSSGPDTQKQSIRTIGSTRQESDGGNASAEPQRRDTGSHRRP